MLRLIYLGCVAVAAIWLAALWRTPAHAHVAHHRHARHIVRHHLARVPIPIPRPQWGEIWYWQHVNAGRWAEDRT